MVSGKKNLPAGKQAGSHAFTSFLSGFKSFFFFSKMWALTNFSLVQRFLAACLTLNTVLFLLAFQHEFEVCGGGGGFSGSSPRPIGSCIGYSRIRNCSVLRLRAFCNRKGQ